VHTMPAIYNCRNRLSCPLLHRILATVPSLDILSMIVLYTVAVSRFLVADAKPCHSSITY
jgi:hypothetical protein